METMVKVESASQTQAKMRYCTTVTSEEWDEREASGLVKCKRHPNRWFVLCIDFFTDQQLTYL